MRTGGPSVEPGWLVDQLPGALGRDPFARRFTSLFEQVADTVRLQVDNIGLLADVDVAPEAMVTYLGSWLGLGGIDESMTTDRLREVVATEGFLLARTGTRTGLQRRLELLTGRPVEVRDTGTVTRASADGRARDRPRQVRVTFDEVPAVEQPAALREILDHVPVGVSVEVVVDGVRVHPPLAGGVGSEDRA